MNLALLLIACNPQDATVDGSYTVWISETTSGSITDGYDVTEASLLNCYDQEDSGADGECPEGLDDVISEAYP